MYKNILDNILADIQQDEASYGVKKGALIGEEREHGSMVGEDGSEGEDMITAALDRIARSGAHAASDWRNQGQKDQSDFIGETILNAQGKSTEDSGKSHLSNARVASLIEEMFYRGYTPSKVSSELEKMADLHAWDRQFSAAAVKDMSGVIGFSFIEPNHYNTCKETMDNMKKSGALNNVLSVKKIASCQGCVKNCGGHCSLFQRPIVASAQELKDVVSSKYGTVNKAKLASIHDRRKDVGHTAKTPGNHDIGTTGGFSHVQAKEEKVITASKVASALELADFPTAYAQMLPIYGKVATKRAFQQYINGLKTSGQKVDISKLDCKFLPGKLANGNPIIGSKNCAGCTKRCGMHCGLTGGTLLSFPGMESLKSNKRASADAKEGHQVLAEYQLESSSHQDIHGDIDTSGYRFDDVDARGDMTLEF